MTYDFSLLKQELSIWRAEGLRLPIWWRDDDAVDQSAALDRLIGLATTLKMPVHLAVIPKYATAALASVCSNVTVTVPMVHGWEHQNHARPWRKRSEFGQVREGAIAEAKAGLETLRTLFGPNLLKMFVPPWNRIAAELIAELPNIGYSGLSDFNARPQRFAAPGLVRINTHVDPIFWRGGGGLVPPETQINTLVQILQNRRMGGSDQAEPLGFLTHHLVHDEPIWSFCHACLSTLLDGGGEPINLLTLKDKLA